MSAISDLYSVLSDAPSPAYAAKMLHHVPAAPVLDREWFILERAKSRAVLDIGAVGPMHEALRRVAGSLWGIDRHSSPPVYVPGGAVDAGIIGFDLDDVTLADLPSSSGREPVNLVVCGEVLEHLSNPGHFLVRLRRQYPVETIITVPNAFCASGFYEVQQGREVVNRDHVAWYSHTTLMELLRRVGYRVQEWGWYRGRPLVAEGLIVVVRP